MADLAIKTRAETFEHLKQLARTLFPDEDWSGLREGAFETLLAKLVTELSVLNGQYLDLRARQAYIDSVDIRQDLRKICENLGLMPRERAAAEVSVAITATNTVTVPLGTRLGTDSGEVFSTTAALTLTSPSALTASVLCIHAEYQNQSFRARGDAGEVLALNRDDVVIKWLRVLVNGVEWSRVDDLRDAGPTSLVYRTVFDERNRVSLKFGDDIRGFRLPADAEVLVDVFTGGGPAGNSVGSGAITEVLDSFTNSDRIDSLTNALAPTGGRAAESLEAIRPQIPAQMRSVSGLVNSSDSAQVIKGSLSFIADARVMPGYAVVNNVFVPTATVVAYPSATSVQALSTAQKTELAAFLAARGMIGVQWAQSDAYQAPVELEIEVRLANRQLELQKATEIIAALLSDDTAPFVFDNLGFDKTYTEQQIIDRILAVDGVLYAQARRLARVPQTFITNGPPGTDSWAADIELGENAEDGYYHFHAVTTTTGRVHFFRPVFVDQIGPDFARSSEINWLAEEHTYDASSEFNNDSGPYVKINASKLEFKQLTRVWKDDQFNDTGTGNYNAKYLLRVRFTNTDGSLATSYYHVSDTTKPGTITTVENASSPIDGYAITANLRDYVASDISVQLLRDQTFGQTGYFHTPTGQLLSVTHNDHNTLYFSTSNVLPTVPINQHSYLSFNEAALNTATDNWLANGKGLLIRVDTTADFSRIGDRLVIYTTPQLAKELGFKHDTEVFTLAEANIRIRFI